MLIQPLKREITNSLLIVCMTSLFGDVLNAHNGFLKSLFWDQQNNQVTASLHQAARGNCNSKYPPSLSKQVGAVDTTPTHSTGFWRQSKAG